MLSNLGGIGSSSISGHQLSTERKTESQTIDKTAQCSVTLMYKAKIGESCRKVTATWSRCLVNYSLTIAVEKENNSDDDENHYSCKIDFKAWQFWGKKGLKSFEVEGERVDVYWDFRQAKFTNSPEPSSDYYVAVVSDEEVTLLLGDSKKDAYKRTKKRPSLVEPTLTGKKEHVQGKRLFCTRATLGELGQKEHDIVIENSLLRPDDPEMWISIDGTTAIRIMNLHWRFRGNETVSVNNNPVQIFWDVHDWLYGSPGSSHGLFIFKPGTLDCVRQAQDWPKEAVMMNGQSNDGPAFCHVLYAWKTE